MSPKTKLGRNPFEKGGKSLPKRPAAKKERSSKRTRARSPRGWLEVLIQYWLPRLQAYLKALRHYASRA